ncbi:hypothetical protein [Actinacidiphila glaucinigra]|uniref:hypothetical protein n=1 Tax=Actinacidiphila glaucinigra TaxID=235986 RepID=UPI0035DBE2E3
MPPTPPDLQVHADAIIAALQGAGLVVGDGIAPDPPPADGLYVVLYTDPGQVLSESLADQRTNLAVGFQLTCVGPVAARVRWLVHTCRTALFPPLTIEGRAAWRAEELGGPPMQRDRDVTPAVFYQPVQYRLQTTTS